MCDSCQQAIGNVPRIVGLNCSSVDVRACQQIVRMFFPHICFAEGAHVDDFLSLEVRFEEGRREEKVPVALKAVWHCGEETVSHVMHREEITRLWYLGSGLESDLVTDLDADPGFILESDAILALDPDLRAGSAWSKEPVVQIAAKQAVLRLLEKMTGQRMSWGVLTGVRPGRLWQNLTDRGLSYEERSRVLMSYYLVDEIKVELLQAIAEEQKCYLGWQGKEGHKLKNISSLEDIRTESARKAHQSHRSDRGERMVAVYVSIPFCLSRCSYCTFPGYVGESVDRAGKIDAYLETLFQEMNLLSQDIDTYGLGINTVYIGGGTPTVLDAEQLRRLIGHLKVLLPWQDTIEFCCEAGRPDTITAEKLALLAAAGVNRLCINPQTLDDRTLVRVGRSHSTGDFVRVYELARDITSWHINGDMILGLPGEDEAHTDKTAEGLVKMGLDSITVHYLTLKRGSDMWRRSYEGFAGNGAGRSCTNVAEDGQRLVCMGEAVRQRLMGAAYHPYYLYRQKGMVGNLENVGYCRPGAQCLYNIVMIAESQHVVGLGAGAASKILMRGRHKNFYHPKDIISYGKRFYETAAKRRELWRALYSRGHTKA